MRLKIFAAVAFVLSCAPVQAETGTGEASWYGSESGSHTANGERFRPMGKTVAHRSLPFGTVLQITDRASGRSVTCRVTDRGPARWTGRILDLSRGCATDLGIVGRGKAIVDYQIVSR